MGREIRKVPAGWVHPVYTQENAHRSTLIGQAIPMHDEDYDSAAEKWIAEFRLWLEGKHPDQAKDYCDTKYFWDWHGGPPDRNSYRERKWAEEEATHVQMYETVSEGTPVSPVFATRQELAEYLIANGDYWDQYRGDGGWSRKARLLSLSAMLDGHQAA